VGTINKQPLSIDKTGAFTMNLSFISSNPMPTDNDRSVILHQFGHVLGLVHEYEFRLIKLLGII
jgi:bacillopeptidase F (M6 metalloprotease family)